jgi:hypothetical protein
VQSVQVHLNRERNIFVPIHRMLIPMKVVSDSDLIPVTHSDAMPVRVGAKRRWLSDRA